MDRHPLDRVERHRPRNVRIGGTSQGACDGVPPDGGSPFVNVFQTLAILACVGVLGIVGACALGGDDAPAIDPPPPVAAPPTVTIECGRLWTSETGWIQVCNMEGIDQ